jgi:hypothetical protein
MRKRPLACSNCLADLLSVGLGPLQRVRSVQQLLCALSVCSSARAVVNPDEEHVVPPPVEFQPACITGEMREYQLEGLRWLVARYDDGLNAILADEMVRGGSGV